MRAVIHLHDYDPDEAEPNGPHDRSVDVRSHFDTLETEWFAGSGNLHVVDPVVEQVADTVAGNVIIEGKSTADNPTGIRRVPNATLVTVYADD